MENLGQWIPTVLFIATVLGWAVKYGSDQQRQKSINEMQDREMDRLKEDFKTEKDHNAMQHREFYDYGKETIVIRADIKHILSALDEIKLMLDRRKDQRE